MPALQGLPSDEAVLALRSFRQVFNAVKSHFRNLESLSGLGGAQVWALSVIEQSPGIGMGALAQAMDIQRSTASNLIKGLAERGLVSLHRDDQDRRSVQLHVLPAGRQVLQHSPGPLNGVLPDALARLDADTLNNLNRDLSKLLNELQQVDPKASQRPLAQM